MKGIVPDHIKDARLQELQNLLLNQQIEFNEKFLGETVEVV